jgi:flagellar hook-basal body complex protein FliE
MSDVAINQVLAQMRSMQALAQGQSVGIAPSGAEAVQSSQFSNLMTQSIADVNASMQESKALTAAFESGDPSVSLAEVMITAQKASLQFTGMTEVRNKLLNAYQEVMNMPV